jgi:chitinase
MTRIRPALIAAALSAVFPVACAARQLPAPAIVAYVFAHNAPLAPGQVDARNLTRINYAFANINDGRMVAGSASDAGNLAILTALRLQNPSLSVLVSVGGWLWSTNFSDIALTAESRARFVQSAMDFLLLYQLDGLDVDWEYPGMPGAGHKFRPEDKKNFTLLLTSLRRRFKQESNKSGRKFFLTLAAGASDEFLAHTEMAKVARVVDTVNLMSYDYYEPGSGPSTGHHAPLFTNPQDPIKISADASVRAFERAGVPASKILLGVPFYGHIWGEVADTNHGLFQPGKPMANGYAPYSLIETTMLDHGFTRYWDAVSSVPSLYSAEKRIFVTYEDPQSLAAKCDYVSHQELGGVMFWDYSGDPSGKLLATIHSSLYRSAPDSTTQK